MNKFAEALLHLHSFNIKNKKSDDSSERRLKGVNQSADKIKTDKVKMKNLNVFPTCFGVVRVLVWMAGKGLLSVGFLDLVKKKNINEVFINDFIFITLNKTEELAD